MSVYIDAIGLRTAFESPPDGTVWLLDRTNGDVVGVSVVGLACAEEDPSTLDAHQRAEAERARPIVEGGDRYLEIPREDPNVFRADVDAFVRGLGPERARRAMPAVTADRALAEATLRHAGLADDWRRFERERRDGRIARWLDDHGLPPEWR